MGTSIVSLDDFIVRIKHGVLVSKDVQTGDQYQVSKRFFDDRTHWEYGLTIVKVNEVVHSVHRYGFEAKHLLGGNGQRVWSFRSVEPADRLSVTDVFLDLILVASLPTVDTIGLHPRYLQCRDWLRRAEPEGLISVLRILDMDRRSFLAHRFRDLRSMLIRHESDPSFFHD